MQTCLRTLLLPLAVAAAFAQPRPMPAPKLLKAPAEWRFESMPVPPGFAPDVALSGFEEARFAPGVFDNTSVNYFTYLLAIAANGNPTLDPPALKDFLEKYYRGLSVGLARRKGQSPDPAQMLAEVATAGSGRLTAAMVFFDSFTDGRKITLNIEARVFPQTAAKRTILLLLISSQPKAHAVWTTLREIADKLDFAPEP
jgi:hypothetical protein